MTIEELLREEWDYEKMSARVEKINSRLPGADKHEAYNHIRSYLAAVAKDHGIDFHKETYGE